MKNLKDLKQYLEKEIHSRRFLQDGVELVATLETLNEDIEDARKTSASEAKRRDKAIKDREAEEAALAGVKAEIVRKREEAASIISDAELEVKKMDKAAKIAASELANKTSNELLGENSDIVKAKQTKKELTAEVTALKNTKAELEDHIEGLRKKFT